MRKLNLFGNNAGRNFALCAVLTLAGIVISQSNLSAIYKKDEGNLVRNIKIDTESSSTALSEDFFLYDDFVVEECICLNNASVFDKGQFGQIIKIDAPAGQQWYIHFADWIFDPELEVMGEPTEESFEMGIQYPLTNFSSGPYGYQLLEVPTSDPEVSEYYLAGITINQTAYNIVLRNDYGDQIIINSNTCQYNTDVIEGPVGVEPNSIATYCIQDYDENLVNNWFILSGDASLMGPSPGKCVDVLFGSTLGDIVMIGQEEMNDEECFQHPMLAVGIGVSNGSLACLSEVNASLNKYCELELTPEALLTSEINPNAVLSVIYTDIQGNMLPDDVDWSSYLGQTVVAKVMDHISGNSCWSFINIEDKSAPEIECFDLTISCIDMAGYNGPFTLDNCSGAGELIQTGETKEAQDCDPDYVYVVTRTYKAVDEYGNSSPECTQTIYVERPNLDDIEGPKNYTVENNNALSCTGYVMNEAGEIDPLTYGVPTLEGVNLYPNDNQFCNLGVAYQDVVLPTNECVQKIMRTWTVFEWWCTFGEMDTFIQVFNIADMADPIITCPSDMVVSSNGTSCEGTITLPAAEVSDDCTENPVVDITYPGGFIDNSNGGVIELPIGTHEVTYTVYDDCFNSSSCSILVTVQDASAPVAVCHQNTVLGLKSDGTTYAYAEAFDDGSYDDCGFDRIEVKRMDEGSACGADEDFFSEKVNFCCADVGDTVIVILRAWDIEGNYNECMVNVIIQDKNPPVISCPGDITLDCLTEFNLDDLSEYGVATATDNCMVSPITESVQSNISECRTGTIVRTFIASDGNGSATCSQTITVVNPEPFNGLDITWPLDYETSEGCNAGTLSPDSLPAPYDYPVLVEDFCDQVALTHSDLVYNIVGSNGACQKIVRTWIIEDFCQPLGNNEFESWTYDQTITISNEVAPTITSDCSDITVCSMNENCATGLVSLTASAMDDCTPGDMLDWSYAIDLDIDGTVDITDDGKGGTIDAEAEYPLGTHSIIYSFEDLCGNKVSCTQEFTIESCVGPAIVCVQGLSVALVPMDTDGDNEVDNEMATVKAKMFDASSVHPCGQELTFSFTENPADSCKTFNCNDIGLNDITVYVIDETGRFDLCVTTIDVQDNNNVDICRGVEDCIVMPADITVTDCVADLDPATINSMPDVDPECICTQYTFDFIDTDISDGNNTCTVISREWKVIFTCGFPKEFFTTQIITKLNDKAPIISCPASVTVSSDSDACFGDATLGLPSVSSDCSTDITITNDSQYATSNEGVASGSYPVGTTSVIYTVTDKCNNASTCEVFVTVTDGADPVCSTNDITISVLDATVDITISVDDIDNNSNDECGNITSRTLSRETFGCSDAGSTIEVTLTVTDDSGNLSSCTANVTVLDEVAPICQVRNTNLNIINPGTFTLPVFLVDDGSFDECGEISTITATPNEFSCDDLGPNDVTITVTDDSGNSSTCISVVTVRDPIAPECNVMDITVELDGSDQATISGADLDNGSSDFCSGISTITVSPSVFTCGEVGQNDVTVTVTDNEGNSSTCTAVVTVESNPNLVCTADDITVYLESTGSVSIAPQDIDGGSGIPCADDITLSINRDEFFCTDVGVNNEVTLTVTDGIQSINCIANVTVLDTLPPVLTCPADLTVNCQDLSNDLSEYGSLSTAGSNCDVLPGDIVETVTTELDDCGVGTITRSFLAVDINGNSATCDQIITIINPDPFEEADIIWPMDTVRVFQCISIDPDTLGSTPSISVGMESCSNVSLSYEDLSLTNNANCEDTISRTWTALDSCQLVQGTSSGIFTFEQIIIVNDEMAPIITAVDSIVQCTGDVNYIFDVTDCNDVTVSNDSPVSSGGNDISGTYPIGETIVHLSAIDRCGNVAEDSILVIIGMDSIPPSIVCINRTIIIEEDGVTEVTAGDSEWYFSVSDNETDSVDLMYSFNRDFIMDTLRFTCDSVIVKSHVIQLFVKDECGNVDSCMASYVTIDPNNVCTGGLAIIQGQITTEAEKNVPNVQVNLVNGNLYEMTNGSGLYHFPEMTVGSVYELKPYKDTDHLAGVSTLDLVLIQRHILGISEFISPYQSIAADINRTGDISGKDIVDLKKNILGIKDAFPNNTSWRFVDSDYEFINKEYPFNEIFSESYMIYDLNGPVNKDFVGVKIGDVNGSIQTSSTPSVSVRTRDMLITSSDKIVNGDFEVPFNVEESVIISGFQLSLEIGNSIQFLSIESDNFEISATDYTLSQKGNIQMLNISVVPSSDISLEKGEALFTLNMTAESTMQIAEVLDFNIDFDNELYTNTLEARNLELGFNSISEDGMTDVLNQNIPNPWTDKTVVTFNLLKDQNVSFNIYNVTGKLIRTITGDYEKGSHSIEIESGLFEESGVYYYELVTDSDRLSKRMILIK